MDDHFEIDRIYIVLASYLKLLHMRYGSKTAVEKRCKPWIICEIVPWQTDRDRIQLGVSDEPLL